MRWLLRLFKRRTTHEQLWAVVVKEAKAGDVEETLSAIAKWMDHEATCCNHPAQRGCVEDAAEGVRHAAFAFYASTK